MTSSDQPVTPPTGAPHDPRSATSPNDGGWSAEMSVSSEWFAEQESSLDPPEPVAPRTIPLDDDYVLIGRHSATQDIHPILDAGSDAGCSRRQADLTLSEEGWTLRDLTSVNGTFLVRAGESFPPVEVTDPVLVHPGDQIFVGAWTRIVLRHRDPVA